MLKMQVKQKARELIEQQIKDQKLLLQKFEHAKTVEEKSLILNVHINRFYSYRILLGVVPYTLEK